MNSVTSNPAGFRPTLRTEEKSTFIIIGVIMSQISTAIGALIWLPAPNSMPRRLATAAGRSLPRSTPGHHAEPHPQREIALERAQPARWLMPAV